MCSQLLDELPIVCTRARRETGSNIGCAFSRSLLQPHLPEGANAPPARQQQRAHPSSDETCGQARRNKFEQITWDEAIDILATNLNRIREKYGSKAVAFIPWSGSYAAINGGMPGAIKRFGNIFEGTIVVDGVDSECLQVCRRSLPIWQAVWPPSFWDRNRKT